LPIVEDLVDVGVVGVVRWRLSSRWRNSDRPS